MPFAYPTAAEYSSQAIQSEYDKATAEYDETRFVNELRNARQWRLVVIWKRISWHSGLCQKEAFAHVCIIMHMWANKFWGLQ